MEAFVLMLALCHVSEDREMVVDEVDLIELNVVLDNEDCLVCRQYIFWDLAGEGLTVVDWRMAKHCGQPFCLHGRKCLMWMDRGTMRMVRAKSFVHSKATYDIEIAERKKLPQHKRRKLSRSTRIPGESGRGSSRCAKKRWRSMAKSGLSICKM